MKRTFTAGIQREGPWYVARRLEMDTASQGETEAEALANLRDALELHFQPPVATGMPRIHTVEVEVGAA